MAYTRTILVCGLLALAPALMPGVAPAQPAAPAVRAFETETFSGTELLAGKRTTQSECAARPGAVWVDVDGAGECIRYYHAAAGAGGTEAIVYFDDDVLASNRRGESRPNESYLKLSPAALQNGSASWARALQMPYVHLGRPGVSGSSGEHAQRRTPREVALVSAALDAVKAVHGFKRLHLVGFGHGGHVAASLLARRDDLGCVVLASALLSLRTWLEDLGLRQDVTGRKDAVDPLALADKIANRPELRIFVLTDPDDVVVSARSQTLYVRRLSDAGLPVQQLFVAASDPASHALWREARQVAAACAKGGVTHKIAAQYENKKPETPPDAAEPPLHTADTLTLGVAIDERQCKALGSALWLHVDRRAFCVRYWMSTAGGRKDEALLYVHGDIGGVVDGKVGLADPSKRLTAASLQRDAHRWSRIYGGPYIALGRPGALGSSGHHLRDRRMLIEVRVIAAAIDALKEQHGFKRLHAVGQSGGGHTIAALLQTRGDLGCAVITSGTVSVKGHHRDMGKPLNAKVVSSYDPIDHVEAMEQHPGRRIILLSDPEDRVVPIRSQREFVERVKAKGLPVLHLTAGAGDERSHGLGSNGLRLAVDCAKGVDDETLAARYQTRPAPSARRP
jgi:dienelactone hydrolase